MINKKMLVIVVLLAILVTAGASAQQSAFQGIWFGEISSVVVFGHRHSVNRTGYRIEISGNRWSQFYNNQIEAGGTARFSAGRAELLLADGRLAWDLRLLAPGLVEQPTHIAGAFRFRLR